MGTFVKLDDSGWNRDLIYIDINKNNAIDMLSNVFYGFLSKMIGNHDVIVVLCIGTDRATGDSLGPLIGYKLKDIAFNNVLVLGNLEKPVHAKNLTETVASIHDIYEQPFIIAIDACLGKHEHIGLLTIGEGSIKPGAGVKKNLPAVGDIFITGIVNFSGVMDMLILQNTRLSLVMKMADVISSAIIVGLSKYQIFFDDNKNNTIEIWVTKLLQ